MESRRTGNGSDCSPSCGNNERLPDRLLSSLVAQHACHDGDCVLLVAWLLFSLTMVSAMVTAHPSITWASNAGNKAFVEQSALVSTPASCGWHMQLIELQMLGGMLSCACQRPAMMQPVDQVPLLFRHSHPVLSRPTVPNI